MQLGKFVAHKQRRKTYKNKIGFENFDNASQNRHYLRNGSHVGDKTIFK